MNLNRSLHVLAMAAALLLVTACQSKGPTPKDGATSTGSAPSGVIEAQGSQDPHAGMAPPSNPHEGGAASGRPDASGMIDVGAVSFKLPPKWEAQQPSSSMRRAQVSASGSAGPAELVVYFFGPQGAGTAMANIDRWIGQFANPDGSPISGVEPTTSKVSTFEVTQVEVAGQYTGGMAATGQAQPVQGGQRLLAAIVTTDGGPYYFKFLGPDATVKAHRAAFGDVIASVISSP
ncbi:MAG: hypothetical protein JRF54_13275 [Deltaproteobacteria bacterium]|nr:hypothetical protein [Deltaproteobacteria bacterium]